MLARQELCDTYKCSMQAILAATGEGNDSLVGASIAQAGQVENVKTVRSRALPFLLPHLLPCAYLWPSHVPRDLNIRPRGRTLIAVNRGHHSEKC